jgi:hypothetical protein
MTCEPVGSYISKRYIFHIGHRPARVSAHIYHRYYFLSGASAYTGCAEILYSVWGIGLHRMCRCIIFCLGYRPIQEVHIYHFLFGYRPARVLHGRPIQDVQRYHLLSGVSACKGSAWPAYTGCAEISSSVWGVGLQGFCMAGLYRMCRDIIFCLGCRPARVLHGRPIHFLHRPAGVLYTWFCRPMYMSYQQVMQYHKTERCGDTAGQLGCQMG